MSASAPIFKKIALIGVGLIGSSIAHASKRKGLAGHVAGYVPRAETRAKAQAAGFADSLHADIAPAAPDARLRTATGGVAFAALLFILSGACGLAYEVVWTRYLGLFLGNTVLLHTAVLGSFMGGMALGSLLVGRFAERVAHPLKAYGWLELGISIYALAFPALSGAGERFDVLRQAAGCMSQPARQLQRMRYVKNNGNAEFAHDRK